MHEGMAEAELDPSLLKPEDCVVENEDPARLRRILKYADQAGKSPLGLSDCCVRPQPRVA
jgi:hypothetical protein